MEKVSYSELTNEITKDSTVRIDYNGVSIDVKIILPYVDTLTFIDFVVTSCFDEDTSEYLPEKKDFLLRYATLLLYTNIELPESDSECFEFLYSHSDLISSVLNVVDRSQFDAMTEAIDNKIAQIVEASSNEVLHNINTLCDTITVVIEMLDKQFEGIDEGDIKKTMSALYDSRLLDTNKFVESYMTDKKDKK